MRIAVYCGSSSQSVNHHLELAREMGRAIGRGGHSLVYGGGRTGLMGAVADAALAEGAHVSGVILDRWIESAGHSGLDELISVSDMRHRKAGLERAADAFIALPGGLGTFEEVTEILSFRKVGLHQRPVVFLNSDGFFDPFFALVDRAVSAKLDKPEVRDYFAIARDAEHAVYLCETHGAEPEG